MVSPNPMKITIATEPFESADSRRLIADLDAHLASPYSSDERFGPNLKPEEIASGVGAFVMARAEGRAIGCGALRKLDESTAEVKRMHAEPEQRGRGVAKRDPSPPPARRP
jgi:GNAT superfamily N-acetyltransferase